MKISEITLDYVKEYLRVYDESDDKLIESFMNISKSYIKSYTGLTYDKIYTIDELSIAYLLLISDYYDNRSGTVASNTTTNISLKNILNMHSINLL